MLLKYGRNVFRWQLWMERAVGCLLTALALASPCRGQELSSLPYHAPKESQPYVPKHFIGDFNGDGKEEVLTYYGGTRTWESQVYAGGEIQFAPLGNTDGLGE